ncbi:MAG: winged helix-turn-helix domain-containing protein [Terriglobales bacterium]
MTPAPNEPVFSGGTWQLWPLRLQLLNAAAAHALTRCEARILGLLIRHAGAPLTRAGALELLRGDVLSSRALDAHVFRLRHRIPNLPVRTIPGVGYAWQESKEISHA